MATDTLYGVMTLFQTSFSNVPSGDGRLAYFKDWIDQTNDLGAQVIRLPGDWRMLEEHGDNAWGQWYIDETVEIIKYAGEKGISTIFEFAQTPDWAKADSGGNVWSFPEQPKQFAQAAAHLHTQFMQAGVDKYVSAWEIWNEPNVTVFWPDGEYRNPGDASDGTDIAVTKAAALQYVQLLNGAYSALHAVDPGVKVLGGSLAGTDFEYTKWMLDAGAKFDGFSVHPYTRPFESGSPTPGSPTDDPTLYPEDWGSSNTLNERWSFEHGLEKIHDMLVSYGKSGDLWLTEMGWRLPSNSSWNYVPGEQAQADYLQTALELIRDWDFIKAVTIFNLYDSGDGDFGILRPDGSWRPSATTFYNFVNSMPSPNVSGRNEIFGTAGADELHGKSTAANAIYGYGDDDFIVAGVKRDLIQAGGGDDVIVGGRGLATVNGGAGEDTFVIHGRNAEYTVTENDDRLLLTSGTTASNLRKVEWIVFNDKAGGFSINVNDFLGHAGDLRGSSGADRVLGNAGNEFLYGRGDNDIIDGRAGADIMFGGRGNDIYKADNIHDMVVEAASSGKDGISASVSYSINYLKHVENIELTGNAANATGNRLDNSISGNREDNVLRGNGGDDQLMGRGGNDAFNGGNGADHFIFRAGSGQDTIKDFALDAGDMIDLRGIVGISDFSDLISNHMTDNGTNVVISLGADASITISNIGQASALTENDFIFG